MASILLFLKASFCRERERVPCELALFRFSFIMVHYRTLLACLSPSEMRSMHHVSPSRLTKSCLVTKKLHDTGFLSLCDQQRLFSEAIS